MAAPASTDEFLDLIRKSQVLDDKKLDSYWAQLSASGHFPADAGKLAGLMIRDGLLTHFQAEQILQGKWRRFSIGKYKVLERLGSGGMGSVYLCEHKLMRRRVAVKVLPTAKAADPASLERFYREARAVAALDHPNIVHAYDIDQDDQLHFLVMEFVDGSNLQELVKKSGPLDFTRACHYIRQSALGLEHAHRAGLVHRDIKPANILVDRNGTVKVLDMGLARFFNDEDDILTKKYDENVLGTADYLSPEQAIDSHNVDIRADIYSLGMTFYFLLTGRAPYGEGTVIQKLRWHGDKDKFPRPVSESRPDMPPALNAILLKMMEKDAGRRYQEPGAVADALDPFTRSAIAPPTAQEMPNLSLAATGHAPALDGGDTAVVKGERTPRSGNPPAPRPAPAAARTPAPTPAPVSKVKAPPPSAPALAPTSPSLPPPVSRSKVVRVFLVVSLFFMFISGVLGLTIWITTASKTSAPEVKTPPPAAPTSSARTLRVSKKLTGLNVHDTLKKALDDAKARDVIVLHEDLAENVEIDRSKGESEITIRVADAAVVWKPAKADQPLLKLVNARGFRFEGRRITLIGAAAGVKTLETLIVIQSDATGIELKDLTLKSFTKAGITLKAAHGSEERPLVVDVDFDGAGSPQATAVYLDEGGNKADVNDWIDIRNRSFNAIVQRIRAKSDAVVGKNFPGLKFVK